MKAFRVAIFAATLSRVILAQLPPISAERMVGRMVRDIDPRDQPLLAQSASRLQSNPDDVNALITVSVVFMHASEKGTINWSFWLVMAQKELIHAVHLAPDNFYAHHNYGQALFMTGDLRPEARAYLQTIAPQAPSLQKPHPNMDLAIAEFTKAIKLNPTSARSYMGRGWAYLMLDDRVHSQADLSKAAQLDPSLKAGMDAEASAIEDMKRGRTLVGTEVAPDSASDKCRSNGEITACSSTTDNPLRMTGEVLPFLQQQAKSLRAEVCTQRPPGHGKALITSQGPVDDNGYRIICGQ